MAERMLFAGMDVGTSGCKMLVYDLEGTLCISPAENIRRKAAVDIVS